MLWYIRVHPTTYMCSMSVVTGGAGFIGSNIVEALVQQGEFVRVLDNCTTGKLSNLERVINQIQFIQGDMRDLSVVCEAVKDMDYVLHHVFGK